MEARPRVVVAVAASAGGVDALTGFVAALPADFPGAVLVVLHIPPTGPSVLPAILSRAGKLPACHPDDGQALTGGVILVAPPDRHMAVSGTQVRVFAGPRENGHRPAADVLLRSVAEHFGHRSAGVVLSGTMEDGATGLRAVRAVGGLTLVQDPAEAAFPGMPLAAIDEADPHVTAPVAALADHICRWATRAPHLSSPSASRVRRQAVLGDPGDVTALTCPECGGTLWHRDEYGAERFSCRVGHTYSAYGLMIGKQTALESAVWTAIVALEERADLCRRIIKRLAETGRATQLARYHSEVSKAEARAKLLRGVITELVQGVSMTYEEEANDHAAS